MSSYLNEVFSSATPAEAVSLPTEEVLAIVDSYNSTVGASRQTSYEAAAKVVERALSAYADSCTPEELVDAARWELHSFMEYSTSGVSDEISIVGEHADLLASGHPHFMNVATPEDLADWIAGAPEITHSTKEVIKKVLSVDSDLIERLHATTRLKTIVASGLISETTSDLLRDAIKITPSD